MYRRIEFSCATWGALIRATSEPAVDPVRGRIQKAPTVWKAPRILTGSWVGADESDGAQRGPA
jgi:hypothetical protein